MPQPFRIPVYKTAPFIRLLLPFITGIILQWYVQVTLPVIIISVISFGLSICFFYFLPLVVGFKLQIVQGALLNLLLVAFGLLIAWQKDIRHSNNWYGNYYKDSDYIIARIDEPLTEKTKSFKADAFV